MREIWKEVPVMGNGYEASNLGRIRAKEKEVKKYCGLHNKVVTQTYKSRILKGTVSLGYVHYNLGHNYKKKRYQGGRLVLFAFVGFPDKGQECCHNNGDPSNNSLDNVRWGTHLENNRDRVRHGTYPTNEDHPMCKHTNEYIKKIRSGEITRKQAHADGINPNYYCQIMSNNIRKGI